MQQKEDAAAGDDAAAEAPAASADAIRLVNGKIEIDEQLKAIAKTYQEETGQEVVIELLWVVELISRDS